MKQSLSKLNNNTLAKKSRSINHKQKKSTQAEVETFYATLNQDQKMLFDLCCTTDENIFCYGSGGTGKSYTMNGIISALRNFYNKQVMVCASTGTAAAILGGSTIHKAFGFPAEICATKDLKPLIHASACLIATDIVVVDEVSLVRCDVFSSLYSSIQKASLHRLEKGLPKIRIIVCGDFAQLPPIISSEIEKATLDRMFGFDVKGAYAFLSPLWAEANFINFELKTVVRQGDKNFIKMLNAIRYGDESNIIWFFDNMCPTEIPNAPYIMPFNKQVDDFNSIEIRKLNGELYEFEPELIADTDETEVERMGLNRKLYLKLGAKVMFTCNCYKYAPWIDGKSLPSYITTDSGYDWAKIHKNGSQGIVRSIEWDDNIDDWKICIEITDPTCESISIWIYRKKHDVYGYRLDARGRLQRYTCGEVISFPLRLAYAISIHRSQGQTYAAANVCTDGSFAHGMAYVALSRCQSIQQCHLMDAVKPWDIICDPDVVNFYRNMEIRELVQ